MNSDQEHGYSVKEVLDQVSGKLDAMAGQMTQMAATHGVILNRVDQLERARDRWADRSWALVLVVLAGNVTGLISLLR